MMFKTYFRRNEVNSKTALTSSSASDMKAKVIDSAAAAIAYHSAALILTYLLT